MSATKTRKMPVTDAAACAKYKASANDCQCPDRQNRGGSWMTEQGSACKHMAAIRLGLVKVSQPRPVVMVPVRNGFEVDFAATAAARRNAAFVAEQAQESHIDPASADAELIGDDLWFGWHFPS